MKKKMVALVLLLGLLVMTAGCSQNTDTDKDSPIEGKGDDQLSGYVTLGEYKGIQYTEANLEVTEEELRAAIDQLVKDNPIEHQIMDRAVEEGDTVSISYIGYLDGVAFDGGTGNDDDLVIGSGSMIPGFEEGIIGTEPGNTVSIDVTFPSTYRPEGTAGSELNGEAVVFDITVNYILESEEAEYNEEFVKANSDYATIEEFEEGTLAELVETKKTEAEDAKLDEIFAQVMENAEITEIPDAEYDKYFDNLKKGYQSMAESQGMELEAFLSLYYQATEEDLDSYADEYAQNMASQALVFKAIAQAENLSVTEEEYEESLTSYFESMGSGYESKEAFEEEMSELLRDSLLFDKVMQFVVDEAVAVTETVEGSEQENS